MIVCLALLRMIMIVHHWLFSKSPPLCQINVWLSLILNTKCQTPLLFAEISPFWHYYCCMRDISIQTVLIWSCVFAFCRCVITGLKSPTLQRAKRPKWCKKWSSYPDGCINMYKEEKEGSPRKNASIFIRCLSWRSVVLLLHVKIKFTVVNLYM